MKMDNLLPIGTVVLLKNSDKKLMIYGILQKEEDDNQIYDYIGVPYPEGYMSVENCYLFNFEMIDKISYVGLIDAEFQMFQYKLKEYFEKENIQE